MRGGWSMSSNYPRDPDNLYDDAIIAVLSIKLRRNGAVSVEGSINDEQYALMLLDTARDAIKSHHNRNRDALIIPSYDTPLST